jgi:hypothetical protein
MGVDGGGSWWGEIRLNGGVGCGNWEELGWSGEEKLEILFQYYFETEKAYSLLFIVFVVD